MRIVKFQSQRMVLEMTREDCAGLADALEEHAECALSPSSAYWEALATAFRSAQHVIAAEGYMVDIDQFEVDLQVKNGSVVA